MDLGQRQGFGVVQGQGDPHSVAPSGSSVAMNAYMQPEVANQHAASGTGGPSPGGNMQYQGGPSPGGNMQYQAPGFAGAPNSFQSADTRGPPNPSMTSLMTQTSARVPIH